MASDDTLKNAPTLPSPAGESPAATPSAGTVYFIGAGPGAPDLITIRGRTIIEQADLVLYADSLVPEIVANLAQKPGVQIVGSSDLHLDQMVALMVAAAQAGGVVARVHTGDPALYGAINEQMRQLDTHAIPYVVVPGVTAAFATAARLAVELTIPDVVQTVILSRIAGRTPVPEGESLRSLASHGASLALYLSIGQIEQVVTDLLAGGSYTLATPVAVAYRATWPDERIIIGTLADIAAQVRAAGLTRHALILVGPALAASELSTRSRLYDATFAHGYRGSAQAGIRDHAAVTSSPRPAIIAVTRHGSALAARLARELDATPVVPARFAADVNIAGAVREPPLPGDVPPDRVRPDVWQSDVTIDNSVGTTGQSPLQHPLPPDHYTGPVVAEIRRRWKQHRQLVLVMATGVAVRAIAPLLGHKADDPAVVCLDEAGRSVIPLLGGHQAGANDLARRIAAITAGHAAITTASDVQELPALDLLGQQAGWKIDPASALTHASAALVNGEPLGLYVDPALPAARTQAETWLEPAAHVVTVAHLDDLNDNTYAAGLLVSHHRLTEQQQHLLTKSILYHPPVLVVGVGSRQGVTAAELRAAIETTLADAHLALASVTALATVDLKADEPGMRQLASDLGVPLQIITQAQLTALDAGQFSPSAAQAQFGLPGVAEPCAMLAAGGDHARLLVPKRSFARCTVAVALRADNATAPMSDQIHPPAQASADLTPADLTLVSLGPGDPQQMTLAARAALAHADVVIGYQTYITQIRPLLAPHQEIIARPMQSELERAQQAIDLAATGRRVALISSGDIGIYAMAGPVFELLAQRGWSGQSPTVRVLPGVSAVQAAAARVGAAINHDLCTISLSDLLTPWEVIEQRLWAAAQGDFVVALYNPRSKERDWQLARARDILLTGRPATTPVVLARNVTRPDEAITLTTLADLDPTQADMFTVVLIGNQQSYQADTHIITPRGYYAQPGSGASQQRDPAAHLTYPISLAQMHGALVVVVGAGPVGERKIRGLLAVAANVLLISPTATPQVQAWAAEGRIQWQQRCYQTDDLAQRPILVFAATNVRAVNAQIAQDAAALDILCNVVDAPHESTFHLPAVHRADGLVVAISTDGVAPARARQMRDRLADLLQDEGTHHDR